MLDFDRQVPDSFRLYEDISEAQDERLKRLYDYWKGLCGERSMPARRDIHPGDISTLLPFVMLVDVNHDTAREDKFVIRLFGTALVEQHGKDWTGKSIFACASPQAAERLFHAGDTVVRTGKPWISAGKVYWVFDREHRSYEVLIMPLSDDGERVTKLFGLTVIF